ncbi:MAG TPA: DinB family protein [Pyrinomonadaceae bacterium]|jgi:uncharacterized damage-inducible protein DinB
MTAQREKKSNPNERELFVKMAFGAWELQNSRLEALIEEFSDEQWRAETAPGKNSGAYLLGHLTAVGDGLLPLFGFRERLYPELEEMFLKNAEKSGLKKPAIADLKKYWRGVNLKITEYFRQMSAEDWFAKHVAVSAEDYAREPHRNKLNVLISRTNHQSYHLGQLAYLKVK